MQRKKKMKRSSFILIFCICFLIPLVGCSKTSEYAKKEEVTPTVSISPIKNIKTKKSIYLESKYLNEYKSIEWIVNKKKKIKLDPSKFKLSKDAKFSMLYNNKSKQEIVKIQHKGYFISISNDVNTTYKSFYKTVKKEYKNISQFNPLTVSDTKDKKNNSITYFESMVGKEYIFLCGTYETKKESGILVTTFIKTGKGVTQIQITSTDKENRGIKYENLQKEIKAIEKVFILVK